MAINKKSFILYSDLIHTVKHLTDEQSGDLFKHILEYVNDNEPTSTNPITKIAFEPIKQQLKRDLKKFEQIKEKRSAAGIKSAEIRKQKATNSTSVESVEQVPTNPTVTVNDNVNDNVTVNVNEISLTKETKFVFKKSMIDLGFEKELVEDWLLVRKTKKATNTLTALNSFTKQIEKSGLDKNEILKICIENSWKGFKSDWLKDEKKETFSESVLGKSKHDKILEQLKANDAQNNKQTLLS